jgi:hypothetical protein
MREEGVKRAMREKNDVADQGRKMTVTPASPLPHLPARRSFARRYAGYFIFTLLASLYLLPIMRILLLGTNEGTLVGGAVRVVHGQVFARDFFEVMGPGTIYWLAAFFKLFGVTFLALRICLFLTSLGTGLLIYFLTRRICGKYWTLPSILLAGTYYGMQWPAISHHVDSNFFGLLSVACVVVWQDRHWKGLLLGAGFLAGCTTCIHQPKGMLLLVAILLWLLMQRLRRAAPMATLGWVAAGYLGAIGLMAVYFWTQGALGSLLYANIVWPSQHYGAVNTVPYALGLFSQYWNHWIIAKGPFNWSIGMAAILITPFCFVAALPALFLVLGLLYKWKTAPPEIPLYAFCGWALWLSEFHRRDIYHLVFGSPLLIVLCVYFLGESRKKIADYLLQILAITSACLAVFNLILVITAHPVATRVGSIAMFKDDPALAFIDQHTMPGDEIFTYPYCPMYYFLTSTSNPTRYSILVYNYNTTSQFQEAIQVLDRRKVRYVLWDTNFAAKTAASVFPQWTGIPPDGFLMETYLESHYNLVEDSDGLRIMERKKEGQDN